MELSIIQVSLKSEPDGKLFFCWRILSDFQVISKTESICEIFSKQANQALKHWTFAGYFVD